MKLNSCIFPVGAKIIISPMIKSKIYPPFSVGFVGGLSGRFGHIPNVVILNVSIIRKGKRGKQRIERGFLTTQIFDVEAKRKKITQSEFKGYPFVHILNTNDVNSNVMDMNPLEFLGWGMAHYTYIIALYEGAANGGKWPQHADHPVNLISSTENRFYDDPAGTLQRYTSKEFRINFVHELRKMEISAARSVLDYKLKLRLAELKAAAYLLYDNIKEKNKLYDEKLVTRNYEYYRNRYAEFRESVFDTETSRYKLLTTKKKTPTPVSSTATAQDLNKYFEAWITKHANQPDFQGIIFRRAGWVDEESKNKFFEGMAYSETIACSKLGTDHYYGTR